MKPGRKKQASISPAAAAGSARASRKEAFLPGTRDHCLVTEGSEVAKKQACGKKIAVPAAVLTAFIQEKIKSGDYVRGLHFRCLKFTGPLNISSIEVRFPIYFDSCDFTGFVDIWGANCRSLGFVDCTLEMGMDLRGMHVAGHLLLRDGFTCKGPLLLRDMKIDDTLEVTGCSLDYDGSNKTGPDGKPLHPKTDDAFGESIGLSRTTAKSLYWKDFKHRLKGKVGLRDVKVDSFESDIDEKDNASWPPQGKLVLDGFTFKRFRHFDFEKAYAWLGLQEEVTTSSLANLAAAYGANNMKSSAERMLAEIKKAEIAEIGNRLSRWFHRVVFWMIGYGLSPQRALFIVVAMIGLHMAFVCYVNTGHGIVPNIAELYKEGCYYGESQDCPKERFAKWTHFDDGTGNLRFLPVAYPEFSSAKYTLESFFPFLDFGQKKFWSFANGGLQFAAALWAAIGIFVGGVFAGGISGLLSPKLK